MHSLKLVCTNRFDFDAQDNEDRKDKTVLSDILGESVLCLIPGKALGEGSRLVQFACLQGIQVFVGFQLALCNLQHFHSYIGAVICGALAGGQQVFQHEAGLRRRWG